MTYKVVITPPAKEQLDMYIGYTIRVFKNKQAAKAIRDDASNTKKRLADVAGSLALCENKILAKNGYRRILFDKHDFFMVYRIVDDMAIVDAMYHELQDYEAIHKRNESQLILHVKKQSTIILGWLFSV